MNFPKPDSISLRMHPYVTCKFPQTFQKILHSICYYATDTHLWTNSMRSSLAYTGFNMDDIKAMLTQHFGPGGKDASWDAGRISANHGAIQTNYARLTFEVGNVIHIKRTSIVVEVK